MPRWKKYALFTAGIVLGLLLLSMLIVPWQIKQQGSAWFAENTSRRLTIEKAFFNPFTLTVEIEGLKLTGQNSEQTFVALQRLMLSGSVRSLIDLAVILDRVELDAPFVNIELLGKQEFNFSDFSRLGGDSPPPAEEASGPLHFSFNNIVISGGSLDFIDRTSAKKSRHEIRELSLSVPFIGNIPYLSDEYVEPQLRLLLNGSEIRAAGQLKPFHQSLETSLTLLLDEVDLAYYASHSPVPLPVEIQSGVLDTQIDLAYRISATEKPKLMLGGELALTDIDIREPDGQELFRLPTLILELDWANLMQLDFNLLSLDIYRPELFVNRDRNGQWNFQRLLPAAPERNAETVEETAGLPLLQVEQVSLIDAQVHYRDAYPPGGFAEKIQAINLQLEQLSTHLNRVTGLAFELQTARGLSLSLNGQLGLNPLTADLSLLLNGFRLKPHYPFLADLLTRPLAGALNLASNIRYDTENNLRLLQTQLGLHSLLVPFGGKDKFTLQDFSVTGGSFDLKKRHLSLGSIRLVGGELAATRRGDGSLTPLDLLRERPAQQTKAEPAAEEADTEGLKVTVGYFAVDDLGLKFTDAGLPKKPQARIDRLSLSLQDLSYPEATPSPFRLSGKIGKRGSFAFSGKLLHTPLRLRANSTIKALPLADFNDFLPEQVKVSLKDGKFYSTLALKLQQQPDGFSGSFGGRINVSDFSLRDPLDQGELLAWESLDLEGIRGEIAPLKLQIEEVALSNYLAKIQIDPEGRVNLNSVTAQPAAAQQAETAEPPREVEALTEDQGKGTPADIRIPAVTLQGGTVSFTDRHLPTTFSTTMYELGGRITGLASEESMLADVDLRGQLENHSPLTVSGKLNPLSEELFADLTIRFQDIDLAPMTPYSGTYLGYVIDKGKLYLDLNYQIEHQNIKASNRIMVDQFTFGDSVKSDKATSLPIALAVALLKDSKGEIHLEVPISGDLSDPSFSIAGAIFTILKNLLVKAATSPFSLLASLLDGDEDFSSIAFAPGIARLSDNQQRKLAKLAGMLAQRPALALEIGAFVDRQEDPEGYRKDQLQQLILATKRQEMQEVGKAPQTQSEINLTEEEYPEYLTRVYQAADFPRPRNFVGLLKKLPVPEMEKLLLANILVEEEQLQGLAQARGRIVRDALIADNEEIKPRIFLKSVDIYQTPKAGNPSRVEFNISSK